MACALPSLFPYRFGLGSQGTVTAISTAVPRSRIDLLRITGA